ncbi:GL25865 [Drosophila persimilis]|uniref:GL25865 n=1 Tax=Drosophila persimilis TaxID=7234 RepID=B4GJI6_DROPE|nr:GL25865 [Drosophila persimilis]
MVPAPTDLSTDILEESAEIGIAVRKIQELMDLEKEAEIVDDDPEFVESPITACCTDKKIDLSHENNVEHTEIMTLFELGDEGDRTPEIDRCLKIFTTKTPSEIDDQLAVTTEFFERLPNSSKFDLEKADLMEEEEEVLDYEEDGDVDDDVLSVTATSWDDMEEEEKQPEPSEASLRNFRTRGATEADIKATEIIMVCYIYTICFTIRARPTCIASSSIGVCSTIGGYPNNPAAVRPGAEHIWPQRESSGSSYNFGAASSCSTHSNNTHA